jgi:hypothetical protein
MQLLQEIQSPWDFFRFVRGEMLMSFTHTAWLSIQHIIQSFQCPAVASVDISENFTQFFNLLFCSCSGAVKKYPKNRMLGQRQVSDGKVIYCDGENGNYCEKKMCYFDRMKHVRLKFRLVTMCGKHMNKCTRRLSRLEQLSEALVLSR